MLQTTPRRLARPHSRALMAGAHFTQVTKQGADGKLDHWVVANWADVDQDNDGYGVRVTIDGDSTYHKADGSKYKFPVKAPETVQVEVRTRATDGGTPSAYCAAETINVTKKGTGPSKATGLTVKRRPKGNRLKWDKSSDTDYKQTVIYRGTSTFGAAVEIDRVSGTTYLDDDENLTKGVNYKYWVRHENRSENLSALESDPDDNTFELIALTDTDTATLAAPTGISLFQSNRDLNADGTVDTALRTTFSGGVSGAAGYEVQILDSASQTSTVRADSGSAWFSAVTTRSYQVRWRTISWNGQAGSWSSYSSSVTPAATTGAPANPSGISVAAWYFGVNVQWTAPTELDYSHTNVRMGSAVSQYSSGGITANSNSCVLFYPQTVFPEYVWLQHVNSSGLASSWVRSSSSVTPQQIIDDHLAAGAPGATATSGLGTSLGGSVNAGAGTSTLLILEWKCTSNTSGVTVTLGSKSQTFDFIDGAPFTMISRENGGGSFSSSKSGGGTVSGAELVAITLR